MSIFKTDFNKLASKDNTEATFDVSIETPHEIKVLEPDGYELSNEAKMAKIVQESLPPLISIGNEWFKYCDGFWQKCTIEEYQPCIMEVIPGTFKTARHVGEIVKHLRIINQQPPEKIKGAYRKSDSSIEINIANGILMLDSDMDLRLLPHDKEKMFTKSLSASYFTDSSAPLFLEVLEQCLPCKEDQRLLKLFCGNILLPDSRFETALVCIGGAGTGKSTLAEAICNALGQGVVVQNSLQQICSTTGYNLPGLANSMVNLGTELNATEMADSSVFKTLVTGETMAVREIYGKPRDMRSTCKLWFLANNLPRFRHGTKAESRRLRFLEFSRQPSRPDVSLKDRLKYEANGILKWMVEGLIELQGRDSIPEGGERSIQVKKRFILNNDHLMAFVEQCCIIGKDQKVKKEMLFDRYEEFCQDNSTTKLEYSQFWKLVREKIPEISETRPRLEGERIRKCGGIGLRSPVGVC